MESVGSKKSLYNMLMTVMFYTTGLICSLRTVAWLVIPMLVPAASHITLRYAPAPLPHLPPTMLLLLLA